MTAKPDGSFRLFQVAGITVYLHWMWALVAYFLIVQRPHAYSSMAWNVAEYLALFGIVLLHEFGHSFATRQVGGTADTILLWPLGGVAYVSPPPRPGAELWSIAAGPLVNVVLFVVLSVALGFDLAEDPDTRRLLKNVWMINTGLLIFNLLPIYPLDGGQILRSLLWFFFGPVRSLLYATCVGFVGIAGLALNGIYFYIVQHDTTAAIWMGIIVFYLFGSCRSAFVYARQATRSGSEPS